MTQCALDRNLKATAAPVSCRVVFKRLPSKDMNTHQNSEALARDFRVRLWNAAGMNLYTASNKRRKGGTYIYCLRNAPNEQSWLLIFTLPRLYTNSLPVFSTVSDVV